AVGTERIEPRADASHRHSQHELRRHCVFLVPFFAVRRSLRFAVPLTHLRRDSLIAQGQRLFPIFRLDESKSRGRKPFVPHRMPALESAGAVLTTVPAACNQTRRVSGRSGMNKSHLRSSDSPPTVVQLPAPNLSRRKSREFVCVS